MIWERMILHLEDKHKHKRGKPDHHGLTLGVNNINVIERLKKNGANKISLKLNTVFKCDPLVHITFHIDF